LLWSGLSIYIFEYFHPVAPYHAKLSRKPAIFRSFTGLEVPEFDTLYKKIDEK
jgi:hypothetical protein